MHWLLLIIAIGLEVAGTSLIKISDGYSKMMPFFLACILMPSSFLIYVIALKKIDVSIAYAMWSGLGCAAMAIVGWRVFHEEISLQKWGFISLIIIGVMGLWFSK